MNILFVSTSYFEPGEPAQGLPNYLRRITRALSRNGHRVFIVYATRYNQYRVEEGVYIYATYVPMTGLSIEEDALLSGYYLNERINCLIDRERIDIIQYTSLKGIGAFYNGNVPAVMRLSSYAKISFGTYRTLTEEEVASMSKRELESSRCMDGIYAPSMVTAHAFGEDIKRSVDVIEPPFENETDVLDATFYCKNLFNKRFVLFFGRLYVEKGICEIAEIIHDFLECNKEFQFVMIGTDTIIEGNKASTIIIDAAKEHANRVLYYPALNHSELYYVIEKADFVVLPSHMENISNACLESMYYGKVVVANEDAGFDQLIIDGVSGFLCRTRDKQQFLNVMNRVANLHEIDKKRIGLVAKKIVLSMAPEHAVDILLDYYSRVIREKRELNQKESTAEYYTSMAKMIIDRKGSAIDGLKQRELDKQFVHSRLLKAWIRNEQKSITIEEIILNRGCNTIAIYGMSDLGVLLANELSDGKVKVLYGIDRSICKCISDFPIINPQKRFTKVDLIIVTAVLEYEEIKKSISSRYDGEVVSLEELLL